MLAVDSEVGLMPNEKPRYVEVPINSPLDSPVSSENSDLVSMSANPNVATGVPAVPRHEERQTPQKSIFGSHLIFGLTKNYPPNAQIRALVVCGAFITHSLLIGLCYWQIESVEDQYTEIIGLGDLEAGREVPIALVVLGVSFVISILWLCLHRIRIFVSVHLIAILGETIGIVYLAMLFNSNYSLIWLATFAISGFLEFVIAQTLLAFIVTCVYKPIN